MIDQIAGHDLGERAAFLLGESDPLKAAKVLARALKIQPKGGRVAAVRILIDRLAQQDRSILVEIAAEVERLRSDGVPAGGVRRAG